MITSVQNNQVKQWNKLRMRKERTATQTFLIEGIHLIETARASGWHMVELIVQEHIATPRWFEEYPVKLVSEHVFKHISETKSPQGMAAIVKIKTFDQQKGNKLLLIDGVQDPGNLGTMIRTADAAGFSCIILGDGTVDLYNDEVVRATQGSLFHIPVIQANLSEKINELKSTGFSIWASALSDDSVEYTKLKTGGKIALIVGNEGAGIQSDLFQVADQVVHIPIHGKAESLNVSIAAGILMYYIQSGE